MSSLDGALGNTVSHSHEKLRTVLRGERKKYSTEGDLMYASGKYVHSGIPHTFPNTGPLYKY